MQGRELQVVSDMKPELSVSKLNLAMLRVMVPWIKPSRLLAGLMLMGIVNAPAGSDAAEPKPHQLVLLDRLTWGLSATSASHLQAVDDEAWLQEQLHPADGSRLPEAARAQIDAMPDVHKPLLTWPRPSTSRAGRPIS